MDKPSLNQIFHTLMLTALMFVANGYILTHKAYAENKWELIRNSDGVLTYSRKIPGSHLNEYKSMTVANAGIEVVGEALRDIPAQPQWMHTWAESRIVKKFDRNNLIFYAVIDTPFPAQDRDLVVANKTTYDLDMGRAIIIASPAVETLVPPQRDRVRITDFEARFTVEFIGRNKTGIVYQYRVDPGGNLPSFVVNIFTKSISHDTLIGLRKLVQNSKYVLAGQHSEDRAIFNRIYNSRQKTKHILKNRLGEYVKNRYIIELMLGNEEIVDTLVYGNGEIAELVFMSSGSHAGMTAAAKKLLAIYLKKFVRSDETITLMLREQKIIDMLIDDKGELAKIIYSGGGSRQSIMEASRKILAVYLRKFIKNEDMITLITNEPYIMDMILDDSGELAKIVLEGSGSRKSILKAGKKLLEAFLKHYINNEYTIALILKDDTILDMLLEDKGEIAKIMLQGKGSRDGIYKAAKKLLAGYLKRFIPNEETIALLLEENIIVDMLIDEKGEIAKIILEGNGSRKSIIEAGKKLLAAYLKKYIKNDYTIALMLKEDSIIDMLLDKNGRVSRIILQEKGSTESIYAAAKLLLEAYLRKFIRNEETISLLLKERMVIDMLIDEKGEISKIVLEGNESRKSILTAGRMLFSAYLRKFISDEQLINKIVSDDTIIDMLMRARVSKEGTLVEDIVGYLKSHYQLDDRTIKSVEKL